MALSVAAIREIARIAIPHYLQAGLTGAQALREFRNAGNAIRTQTFNQLFRQARSIETLRDVWSVVDTDRALKQAYHALTDRNIPTRYQYLFRVEGTDILDGSPAIKNVAIYSDTRLSVDASTSLVEAMLSQITDSDQYEGFEYDHSVEPVLIGAYERNAFSRREAGEA